MTKDEDELRRAIVEACRSMNAMGINQGTSGNVSARYHDVMLITPTSVPYDEMEPEDIAVMPLESEYGAWVGRLQPSTEWHFHLDITRSRPDVGAIVHAHSTYATVLAICGREIPACHYMIAAAGGPTVRVADYATYDGSTVMFDVMGFGTPLDKTPMLLQPGVLGIAWGNDQGNDQPASSQSSIRLPGATRPTCCEWQSRDIQLLAWLVP